MKLQAEENLQVAESPNSAPRAAAMRFTYGSGSRPLNGYTIKRGIGRGGFGEVYFATSDAGKEVALKLIRRNLEVEVRGVTQCLNLKHTNLIDLYDIRSDDNEDEWVIMEYVSGEPLDAVIDRHPNGLPVDEALWWIRGICGGVAYLHDHGIVHRDLKPGNIFSDQGVVKVGDYGLAKFISCSRRSGQTESVGTVHYMAPEISNGRYGKEIDTYALGIMLYELLTGRVPFEGESVGEVLMKHLTAEPELDLLEEPFRDIVRRALAKDPEVRLKSVGEMLALLPGPNGQTFEEVPPSATGFEASRGDASGAAQPHPDREYGAHHDHEEPIYRAIRDGWEHCENVWHNANLHPILRAVTLFALVIGLVVTTTVWLPALFGAFILYGVYYAFRGIFLQTGAPRRRGWTAGQRRRPGIASVSHAQTIAQPGSANQPRPVHPQRQRRLRQNWRDKVHRDLAAKSFRDKFSELLGSMLLAALVALLASLFIPILSGTLGQSEAMAQQIWFMVIGTLGSWAILIPTKFSEGTIEDQVPMRTILLLSGALVGLAGWGLADVLTVNQPYWSHDFSMAPNDSLVHGEWFRWHRDYGNSDDAQPMMRDYVIYLAGLFVLLRWWRQAEFTRLRRLGIWSVIVCLFWAYCLHVVWWFPQPAGMMLAGTIAVATQLSSPWLAPSKRRSLNEEVQAA
jgi:hypothetical protein